MTNNGKEKPVCNDKIHFRNGMKNIMKYKDTTKDYGLTRSFLKSKIFRKCHQY